jgi:hypothetical protein
MRYRADSTRALSLRDLLALAAVVLALASPAVVAVPGALAQETTTTTTATESTDEAEDTDAEESDDDSGASDALIFGGLVIAAFLVYLYRVQDRFFDLGGELARLGRGVRAEPVGALVPSDVRDLVDATSELEISGPGLIAVGENGAQTYSVAPADAGASAVSAPAGGATSWSVTPADAASVQPATGDSVKVTATRPGVFKVNAQRDGSAGSVVVTAVDVSGGATLPFVGAGYGTILIALALLTLATALGMEEVLSGEAIATLFGAVAGYIFLKATTETQTTGDGAASDTTPPAQ